ncbi:MAG: 3-deoxy-manno-octulosonate cytidylyltransferase [Myxococcota bacterium]|nr:3-deoxy-manno-octulosonate cytidylyltransferase [Myxococcota bacterium]MEC8422826.1 3-deoxy-manno-octulosonate cytidylyltransferase [Myxococcota bacterium]
MRALVIVPARLDARRLPGKPLAEIGGVPMVVRVARRASFLPGVRVVVASGDGPVLDVCSRAGVASVLTPRHVPSGTHRVGLAVEALGSPDVPIVNVQGDEPFVEPEHMDAALRLIEGGAMIGTVAAPLRGDPENPDRVKVRFGEDGLAIAFSRQPLGHPEWQHLGLYAFSAGVLPQLLTLPETAGERAERLEQLRWLEHGHPIHVSPVRRSGLSVDTPDDLKAARQAVASSL